MSKILMIDDEPRGVESYREELEVAGHEVVFVRDIDEGLATALRAKEPFDVVLLDIMMPPGDQFENDPKALMGRRTGVRAFEVLREKAPDLPVVVLSNVSDPDLIRSFAAFKKCWFLQKKDYLPYQLARFLRDKVGLTDGEVKP